MISFIVFSISFCLYRACFTHQISSNLSRNLRLWYFDQLVHLNKEINANVYRHSLWEYYKRFHCSFEWQLTPHMTLSIFKPVLSGHYSNPRECPLNTGFTVHSSCVQMLSAITFSHKKRTTPGDKLQWNFIYPRSFRSFFNLQSFFSTESHP